jgi:glyoxylase-like metal-dependent hydrolase (beta-lactamase superfamily II)
MINIKTFSCNMLQENTYVVSDETLQAVVIDYGAFYPEERQAIVDYLRNNQLRPVHLLCTHGHLDHCFGNDTIYDAFGLKPELHAEDEFLAADLTKQAADMFGMPYNRPTPPIGRFLSDGDRISFGSHELRVLHTPGHTPGGVSFYCEAEKVLFTGDTLFRMSVGRTDFERSSWQQLLSSLRHVISPLPDDTTVYCGHGPKTTVGDERKANPYLR